MRNIKEKLKAEAEELQVQGQPGLHSKSLSQKKQKERKQWREGKQGG
jgi:hypothetical protein